MMIGMMTKDVSSCNGMSADAAGCIMRSVAWPDDKECYQV